MLGSTFFSSTWLLLKNVDKRFKILLGFLSVKLLLGFLSIKISNSSVSIEARKLLEISLEGSVG